jgi:hypothetical protein
VQDHNFLVPFLGSKAIAVAGLIVIWLLKRAFAFYNFP